ncbi:hypothetical protein [Nocardiopsis lucentensis]|uniref:hypothetical protein n=1 Tax=Nocardiopsis lucentensis TaxID=53441 RepID=UPI0003491CEA|nr:hypothetical protein [Nocardiopsis lucentensis]
MSVHTLTRAGHPDHVRHWAGHLTTDDTRALARTGHTLHPAGQMPDLPLPAAARTLLEAAHEAGLGWQLTVDEIEDCVELRVYGIATRADNPYSVARFVPWEWQNGRLTPNGWGYRVPVRGGLERIRDLTPATT